MSINNNKSVPFTAYYGDTMDINQKFPSIADAALHYFKDVLYTNEGQSNRLGSL